jgi:cell division protein FtsL
MVFLSAEAGNISEATFKRVINGKQFSYTGDLDHGILIEEVIFNALLDKSEKFKKELIQTIVILTDRVYLVTLNDQSSASDGENTLEYLRTEFSDKEIMSYISENIIDQDKLFFVEAIEDDGKETLFSFTRESDSISFSLKESELKGEMLISGSKKLKLILTKNYISILLAIGIILIPSITIPYANYTIDQKTKELLKLKIEEKKLNIEQKKKEIEIKDTSEKFNSMEKTKDLFSDEKLFQSFLDLNITSKTPIPTATNVPMTKAPSLPNKPVLQSPTKPEKVDATPLPPMPIKEDK